MKKRGNSKIGGDKKTRDKLKINNPRGKKKGGRTPYRRGVNKRVHMHECHNPKNCKCK